MNARADSSGTGRVAATAARVPEIRNACARPIIDAWADVAASQEDSTTTEGRRGAASRSPSSIRAPPATSSALDMPLGPPISVCPA